MRFRLSLSAYEKSNPNPQSGHWPRRLAVLDIRTWHKFNSANSWRKNMYCNEKTHLLEQSKIDHPSPANNKRQQSITKRISKNFPIVATSHQETDGRLSCIYPKSSVHFCNFINPFRIITCGFIKSQRKTRNWWSDFPAQDDDVWSGTLRRNV